MNKKVLKLSIILSLLTIYFFPGRVLDKFSVGYGYPINFFTIYNISFNSTHHLMSSTNLNIINLALNIFIIYIVINILVKVRNRLPRK